MARNRCLKVYVDEEEYTLFEEDAEFAGFSSLSSWARFNLLARARKHARTREQQREERRVRQKRQGKGHWHSGWPRELGCFHCGQQYGGKPHDPVEAHNLSGEQVLMYYAQLRDLDYVDEAAWKRGLERLADAQGIDGEAWLEEHERREEEERRRREAQERVGEEVNRAVDAVQPEPARNMAQYNWLMQLKEHVRAKIEEGEEGELAARAFAKANPWPEGEADDRSEGEAGTPSTVAFDEALGGSDE